LEGKKIERRKDRRDRGVGRTVLFPQQEVILEKKSFLGKVILKNCERKKGEYLARKKRKKGTR